MDREQFLSLDISKQIEFFNAELMNGSSVNKISKSIGISRSISSKFKKHGYILKNNQFSSIEPKKIETKIGRPKRTDKSSKHTVIFNDDIWTELRIKSIKEHTTASEILESLAEDYLNKSLE